MGNSGSARARGRIVYYQNVMEKSKFPDEGGEGCNQQIAWKIRAAQAQDRKSGVKGKSVELGGRRIIKKKKTINKLHGKFGQPKRKNGRASIT